MGEHTMASFIVGKALTRFQTNKKIKMVEIGRLCTSITKCTSIYKKNRVSLHQFFHFFFFLLHLPFDESLGYPQHSTLMTSGFFPLGSFFYLFQKHIFNNIKNNFTLLTIPVITGRIYAEIPNHKLTKIIKISTFQSRSL